MSKILSFIAAAMLLITSSAYAVEPSPALSKLPHTVLESCSCSKSISLQDSKLEMYNCRCGALQCVVVTDKQKKQPAQLECR